MAFHLVLAPNALKGSLSAVEAANAMRRGAQAACADIHISSFPMSDGGDGYLEVMAAHFSALLMDAETTDPLGRKISAPWGWVENARLGIVEMARASGMALLTDAELDPLMASSAGTGKLLKAALNRGAKHILLGLGGTATVDGGMGIADALGAQFFDQTGQRLTPCGANLTKIALLDSSNMVESLKSVYIDLITDVDNPLTGELGAARVFGPQKGADAEQVRRLEQGLDNLADVIFSATGKNIRAIPGAGAAGGAAGMMLALAGAEIHAGARYVAELIGLDASLDDASLVLTAEGKIDSQTLSGKAPAVVAKLAREHDAPCIAIAGSIGKDWGDKALFARIACLRREGMSLEFAKAHADKLMEEATKTIIKEFTRS